MESFGHVLYVTAVFSMFVFLCENGMSAPQQHGERSQKCLGYRLATAGFYLTGGRNISVLCKNRQAGVAVTL